MSDTQQPNSNPSQGAPAPSQGAPAPSQGAPTPSQSAAPAPSQGTSAPSQGNFRPGGSGQGGPNRGGPNRGGGGPNRGGGGPNRGGGGPNRGGGGQNRGGPNRGGGQNRGGPNRGGQGGRGRGGRQQQEPEESNLVEKVVHINRCAKVVKGGRRFSFAALVVVGDGKGQVGVGYGKAKEVPEAIRKGTERANHNMETIKIKGVTIPHEVIGDHDGGKVIMRPASEGTGVIAGGGVRAVLEAVGIHDILSKSLGSNNPGAMVHATLDGLRKLRSAEQIAAIRSTETSEVAEATVAGA